MTQSTGSIASCPTMLKCSVTPVIQLTVVLYTNTDALIHRSQLFCTPGPLVRSIEIIVLWKRSTGLEDGFYRGVVVCCILNSENNSLHKLFTNSLPLSKCNWSGNKYTLKCFSINTLATVCASLFGIRYPQQYLLTLSFAMSRYRFPLVVFHMETKST